MSPLDTLADAGLTVTADGDRLLVSPRHLLTDDLRALIRDNKQGILAALLGTANDHFNLGTPSQEQAGSHPVKSLVLLEIANSVALPMQDGSLQSLPELDERRTCRQCRNLSGDGFCLAAWRGELHGVSRDFEPINDMLQRCPSYAPGPDDVDQREGRFAAYCLSKMRRVTDNT